MQTIKFYKKDGHSFIRLGTQDYKGYTVGNLPNSFGFKEKYLGQNEEGVDQYKEGKSEWFKYKGLTYIPKSDLSW